MKKGLFIIAGAVIIVGVVVTILLWPDTPVKNVVYCTTLSDDACLADSRCEQIWKPIGNFGDMQTAGCRARTEDELAQMHTQAELCIATGGTWSNPERADSESCDCLQLLGVNTAEVGWNEFVRDHGCIDEKTACTELIGGKWKTPTLVESHKVYNREREECFGYGGNDQHFMWNEENNECIGSTYKPLYATCRFNGKRLEDPFYYLEDPSSYMEDY